MQIKTLCSCLVGCHRFVSLRNSTPLGTTRRCAQIARTEIRCQMKSKCLRMMPLSLTSRVINSPHLVRSPKPSHKSRKTWRRYGRKEFKRWTISLPPSNHVVIVTRKIQHATMIRFSNSRIKGQPLLFITSAILLLCSSRGNILQVCLWLQIISHMMLSLSAVPHQVNLCHRHLQTLAESLGKTEFTLTSLRPESNNTTGIEIVAMRRALRINTNSMIFLLTIRLTIDSP